MPGISQQRMSQLPKDVTFTTEEKCLYLLQLSNFLELRFMSLRCDKNKKFDPMLFHEGISSHYFEKCLH
jgi:hypothetical protein